MFAHRTVRLLSATALALTLAACGGGDGDETATPDPAPAVDGELTLVGNDSQRWIPETPTATLVDGSLAITITCDGVVPHNLNIEGVQDDAVLAECTDGTDGTADVALDAGTYTFYCSVPGHRAAGMEGTLTVS